MWVTPKADDGACGYLNSSRLCNIHALRSAQHKPRICQQFPFLLTETPEGIFVGANFFCTSVRDNSGRTMSEHQAELAALIERGATVERINPQAIDVRPGVETDWDDYCSFERKLRSDFQVARALWTAASCQKKSLTATWDQAHPGALDSVAQLLDMLSFAWLKFHLYEDNPEAVADCDEAYAQGSQLPFAEDSWQNFRQIALPMEWEADLQRMIDLELHRKALLVRHSILDNLWSLALAPEFTRNLARLSLARPDRSNWLKALEVASLSLGPSGLGRMRYFPHYSAMLCNLCGSPNPGDI